MGERRRGGTSLVMTMTDINADMEVAARSPPPPTHPSQGIVCPFRLVVNSAFSTSDSRASIEY